MAEKEDVPPDLPELAEDEAALIAAFPLPDGVPDAVVNKSELARALNVSQTTVTNWMTMGLPIAIEGGNGRNYEFRLSVCFAWNQRRLGEEARARSAAADAAAQLSLALLGGEQATGDGVGLSLADQRKLFEAEHHRAVAARDRRDLIRFDEVVAGFDVAFAKFRDGMDGLPDRLARDCGLEGKQIEAAIIACDDVLRSVKLAIGEVIGDGESGDDPA